MSDSVGRHYRGEAGADYFGWQKSLGEIGGELNARKFSDFISPGDAVIDFGCGTGALLANIDCAAKLGIEPNDHARRDAADRGIECVAAPAEVEADFADVIISNHALEHALNPYGELRELRRILKDGGTLVIYVPLDDFRSQPSPERDQNHHVYTWTPLLLRNLLSEAGFDVVDCRLVTHAWPPKTRFFARLPEPLFDAVGRAWAAVRRRRQVMAVAR